MLSCTATQIASRLDLHLFELPHNFLFLINIGLLPQQLLALLSYKSINHFRIEFTLHHALVVDIMDGALHIIHLD